MNDEIQQNVIYKLPQHSTNVAYICKHLRNIAKFFLNFNVIKY